ncbi:hypothetical protein L3Q82_000243 [Scortum barcoo]|uniref:Uncharacterized protein n=1 Tax=Scortum barcoo TaxID=214431 RepID=A0ACB8XAH2_9TELE|nr:hypothetical protein L3Q82_000243 [Scortum barcoo]
MNLEEYFRRIGFHGSYDKLDLTTLKLIHKQHVMSVPFENLSIHCGEKIIMDLEAIFNKIARNGRGGWCLENNFLFGWVLRQMGYDSTMLELQSFQQLASMTLVPLESHLINKVVIDGKAYITDVSFGVSFQVWEPLELVSGKDQPQAAGVFRLIDKGDMWVLEKTSRKSKVLNPDFAQSSLVNREENMKQIYCFTAGKMNLEEYFRRIGFHGSYDKLDLTTLKLIHKQHVMSVPFENLSIHCGEKIIMDLEAIFSKIVRNGRGGWCLENNFLFGWVLRQMGYDSTMLGSRVFNSGINDFSTHLINKVVIDGKAYITDVSFGTSFQVWEPLELVSGKDQPQAAGVFRLIDKGDMWVLEKTSRKSKVLNPDFAQSSLVNREGTKQIYCFTLVPRKMNLEEYFRRIGFHGSYDKLDLTTLMLIHKQHVMSVPFENLSIHCGEKIIMDLEAIFNKIVRNGRGGWCLENNFLFGWVLRQMGYDTTTLSSRVFNMWEPLELVSGKDQPQAAGVFRLIDKGDMWVLEKTSRKSKVLNPDFAQSSLVNRREMKPVYCFTLVPREADHFFDKSHTLQTDPTSLFTNKSICSLQTPTGFRALIGWTYCEVTYKSEEDVDVLDMRDVTDDEIEQILREQFNLKLQNKLKPVSNKSWYTL